MSIESIPAELLLDLEQVLGRAMTGVRDPEEMRKALEEMNRMRKKPVNGSALSTLPLIWFVTPAIH